MVKGAVPYLIPRRNLSTGHTVCVKGKWVLWSWKVCIGLYDCGNVCMLNVLVYAGFFVCVYMSVCVCMCVFSNDSPLTAGPSFQSH